jgi:hypothetical protein
VSLRATRLVLGRREAIDAPTYRGTPPPPSSSRPRPNSFSYFRTCDHFLSRLVPRRPPPETVLGMKPRRPPRQQCKTLHVLLVSVSDMCVGNMSW